jgi:hypothetical protein
LTSPRSHRVEKIKTLLETYPDAVEALQSGNGGRSTDELILRWHELYMPAAYHQGSYAELERVLRRLREATPTLYHHVKHRYLFSKRRTRIVRKNGFGGWRDLDTTHARVIWAVMDKHGTHANRYLAIVEEWDSLVSPVLVDSAILIMERIWQGPLQVPRDALTPDEEQVKDAA